MKKNKIKRYFITSAIPDAKANTAFLSSIENFCKLRKAKLLVQPTQPLYAKYPDLVPELTLNPNVTIVDKDIKLNTNLHISTLPINPEQVDPLTGLDRLSEKQASVIYSSPKQQLKSIASPSMSLPRVLMTPGSITYPNKRKTRRSLIAAKDHVMGGIIVEIEDNRYYHFRQVQADSKGRFVDLGLLYGPDSVEEIGTEALIPGDWHTGSVDPIVRKCTLEMMDHLKPKKLYLHDFFDGISVNHHIKGRHLTKAMMGSSNDLGAELMMCAIELKVLSSYVSETILVKSNHDEFLDRWLDAGHYMEDSLNHTLGLELALAKSRGKDPLEYGLNKYQKFNNVKFLKNDDSSIITKKKIECGAHGHLGPNGSRGSPKAIARSYINSVTGHSHSPSIINGAWTMGTSTHLKLSYNKGPSSWMQTHCVVYSNGHRQLINIINKKWRM